MTISRTDTSIIRGPAIITFNAVTFYTAGDIRVKTNRETFNIMTSTHGKVDERDKQIFTEISFTPFGKVNAGLLSVLYPHTSCVQGSSAMPASDKDVVIWPINGKEKATYKNAFVFKMPDLFLSPVKTMLGEVTLYAIGKNAEPWSTAEHFVSLTDAAFSDTSLSLAETPTVSYTAALGALSAPWNSIMTKSGWTISINAGIEPDEEDTVGVYDYVYTENSSVTARCNPIGIGVADLHSLAATFQGTGAGRGASVTTNAATLAITGGSGKPYINVYKAFLKMPSHVYGKGHRVDELTLETARGITNGALDALFAIGINA